MKNIVVLVSGGGTNLQALIDAQKRGELTGGKITCVISSNPNAYALTRAADNNIETAVIRRKDFAAFEDYDKALTALLQSKQADVVVLAGFMTIPPAIMFLGMNAADKFGSSFSLGFVVLPNVFELMPFGQFFGFLFFVLLFLAAITSSMSLVQPTVALFQESFRWTRGASVILAAVVNLVGTVIVCWYTKNLVALDVFDFWLANFMPFVFAIIQTTFIIFVWGVSNFKTELASGAKIKPPLFLVNVVKYASFPYLLLIAGFWAWKNIGARVREVANNEIAQLSLAFFAALIMLLTALSIIAINRWKRESANENALDAAEENQ